MSLKDAKSGLNENMVMGRRALIQLGATVGFTTLGAAAATAATAWKKPTVKTVKLPSRGAALSPAPNIP